MFSGLYPGSMVGVPGDRLSNVGPPTFVLVALLAFQIGFAEVTRPLVERLLRNDLARRTVTAVNAFALPLFLFHSTGMALARTFGYVVLARQISDDRAPDLIWWLQRPLAVLASLVFHPALDRTGGIEKETTTSSRNPLTISRSRSPSVARPRIPPAPRWCARRHRSRPRTPGTAPIRRHRSAGRR